MIRRTNLKVDVFVPRARETFSPSMQDTVEADFNRELGGEGIAAADDYITLDVGEHQLIFDLSSNEARIDDLVIIRETIKTSLNKVADINVDDDDITIRAANKTIINNIG